MNIVLSLFRDPGTGLDWHEQSASLLEELTCNLKNYPDGEIEFQIYETNHGTAADWPTLTISLKSLAGIAFFSIPLLHKTIRETLAEWKKIKDNLEKLLEWIGKKHIAIYPIEVLFLDSLEELSKLIVITDIELIDLDELPQRNTFGFLNGKVFLFTYRKATNLYQIALDDQRNILWRKTIRLDSEN